MHKSIVAILLTVIVYVFAGMFYYGWAFNHIERPILYVQDMGPEFIVEARHEAAAREAVIWPITLGGRAAIALTRW